ncbi:MAG: hypothetical protein GWP91_25480, partial [Rhodobacterales bacterium]|nr:hypothetical protein [Rhodobacterales bacterium]
MASQDPDATMDGALTHDEGGPELVRKALMVVYRDGIQVVTLNPNSPITVGRCAPSDVVVDSRRL